MNNVYIVMNAKGFVFGVYANRDHASQVFAALAADHTDLRLTTEPIIHQVAHYKPEDLANAVDAAYVAWARGEDDTKEANYWAEVYGVHADDVRQGLARRIKAQHLDRQLVRTDN